MTVYVDGRCLECGEVHAPGCPPTEREEAMTETTEIHCIDCDRRAVIPTVDVELTPTCSSCYGPMRPLDTPMRTMDLSTEGLEALAHCTWTPASLHMTLIHIRNIAAREAYERRNAVEAENQRLRKRLHDYQIDALNRGGKDGMAQMQCVYVVTIHNTEFHCVRNNNHSGTHRFVVDDSSDLENVAREAQRLREALAGMLDQPEDAASYDAMMRRAQEALGLRKEPGE